MRSTKPIAWTILAVLTISGSIAWAWAQDPGPGALSADSKAALDRISADSLKGHLSFLASDLLEGRDTPSRGLDIAAEYIAAQYRRAGLEPIGDDGYFQTAEWKVSEPDASSFQFELEVAGKTMRIPKEAITLVAEGPVEVAAVKLVKVGFAPFAEGKVPVEDVEGKALLVPPSEGKDEINPRTIQTRARGLKPALTILIDRTPSAARGLVGGRLIDPEAPAGGFRLRRPGASGSPVLTIHDPKVIAVLDGLKEGEAGTATLRLGPPVERAVKLRNVLGLLRGSDPMLKDTYVLVTAHYDHVGIGQPVKGDAIYNGANDDGSGTVSVVELANALGSLKERPKRSILFMTVWGEEKGLLGSQYYGRHPVVPIDKTIADVNLEQVGRTDSTEGPQVNTASLTGFDFSSVGETFRKAGELEGVKIYKHPRNSDNYFGASDNQALADLGVPAHTLCVAFQYPDYHGAADHWDKVDYTNMARINRVIGRAILMIADSAEVPTWNADNPKAKRYLKAYQDLHAKP